MLWICCGLVVQRSVSCTVVFCCTAGSTIHRVLKKVPPLACYNFETYMDFDIFGRNVTDKLSNQKTLYYATSNNLCFCTNWWNTKTQKLHFPLKCCISSALPEFNQLLDFFNLFWLMTHTYAAVWLPTSCNKCIFSYKDCWGHGSGERQSIALQQLDRVARTMHQCAVFWVCYFAR